MIFFFFIVICRAINVNGPKHLFVLRLSCLALCLPLFLTKGLRVLNFLGEKFIAVIEAILLAGKQLQRLGINQVGETRSMQFATVRSSFLRKLISVVSSPAVVDNAAKLLSTLNKEGAARGDLLDILITSNDQFPEVCIPLIAALLMLCFLQHIAP